MATPTYSVCVQNAVVATPHTGQQGKCFLAHDGLETDQLSRFSTELRPSLLVLSKVRTNYAKRALDHLYSYKFDLGLNDLKKRR